MFRSVLFCRATRSHLRMPRAPFSSITRHAWNIQRQAFPNFIKSFQRSMFIQTEPTPNVDSIKFKPGVPVLSNSSTLEYLSARDAMASPLARRLFQIEGVRSVMLGSDFLSITKHEDATWQLMKPDIYAAIMDFFSSGEPVVSENGQYTGPKDTEITDQDSETVAMIKELIDTRIRPTIQEDGGDLEYCGFEDGIVKLKLKGACRTCDSSVVTLKSGIENMLMHYVSEVKGVEQVLDEVESMANTEFEKLEKQLGEK